MNGLVIAALGHWRGDPREHCGELKLTAKTQTPAKKLALLLRVLSDPELRDRLLGAAEAIEAEASEAAELVRA